MGRRGLGPVGIQELLAWSVVGWEVPAGGAAFPSFSAMPGPRGSWSLTADGATHFIANLQTGSAAPCFLGSPEASCARSLGPTKLLMTAPLPPAKGWIVGRGWQKGSWARGGGSFGAAVCTVCQVAALVGRENIDVLFLFWSLKFGFFGHICGF